MNTLITHLTWWEWGLLLIYIVYTICRSWWIFNDGLRDALIGEGKTIKLYHLLWGVVDLPAIVLGKFFPILKFIFNIPVFPLKDKK